MPLSIHASSPSGVENNSAGAVTTAAFTPPSNCLLVVFYSADSNQAGGPGEVITVTSSPALAWNVAVAFLGAGSGANGVSWSWVGASPGSMTVTCTSNRTPVASSGVRAFVRVFLGANQKVPIGATFIGAVSAVTGTEVIVPRGMNSWCWYNSFVGGIASIVAASGCTLRDSSGGTTFEGGENAFTVSRTVPDGVPGQPLTVGTSTPSSASNFPTLVEILSDDNTDYPISPAQGIVGPRFRIFNPWQGIDIPAVAGAPAFTDSSIATAHNANTDTNGIKDVTVLDSAVTHAVTVDLAGAKAVSGSEQSAPRVRTAESGTKATNVSSATSPHAVTSVTGIKNIAATTQSIPHPQTRVAYIKGATVSGSAVTHAVTVDLAGTKAVSGSDTAITHAVSVDLAGTKAVSGTEESAPRIRTAESGTKAVSLSSTTAPRVVVNVTGIKNITTTTQSAPHPQTRVTLIKGTSATETAIAHVQTTTPTQTPIQGGSTSAAPHAITLVSGVKGSSATDVAAPRPQTQGTGAKGSSSTPPASARVQSFAAGPKGAIGVETAISHVSTTTPVQVPLRGAGAIASPRVSVLASGTKAVSGTETTTPRLRTSQSAAKGATVLARTAVRTTTVGLDAKGGSYATRAIAHVETTILAQPPAFTIGRLALGIRVPASPSLADAKIQTTSEKPRSELRSSASTGGPR